jgi:hypothetical protein
MKRSRMDAGSFQMLSYTPEAAAAALLAGEVDVALMVNSYASPVVRKLAGTDGVEIGSFARADAYAALFPFLTKRVLPAGAISLERDRPSRDIILLATKTSLVAREDLHPALQYLLLGMIQKAHARSGIFQKAGEFPAAEEVDLALSTQAAHYYKSGEPFLQRYLPFWLAVLVEQLALLLIPLIGLAYPLVTGLSWLYAWEMQRRIFSIYGEVRWLEVQIEKLDDKPPTEEMEQRLVRLEERTRRVKVAAKYLPMLYNLRETLGLVRARFERQRAAGTKDAAAGS